MAEIVRMDRIVKQFPGVLANDEVSLVVEEGEIHCLLGENGAGKSTLMNILYGLISHDEGDIIIRGKTVSFAGPGDAIENGIGMVHQHFMLIPVFTVLENLILGSEHVKGLSLDLEKSRKELTDISEKYGMEMNLDAYVRDISVGMQQRVEILKLLYRGADIMIFDEPTAILTPQEIHELYKVMESLRKRGKTIIFITHKLKEVMECSDRVTVLRDGRNVQMVETSTTNTRELARMMVGREVIFNIERPVVEVGKEILRMEDVHAVNSRDLPALSGINLHVSQGEVVGIAGIDGNGQTELVEVLTGLRRNVSGTIEIDGHNMRHKTTGDFLNTGTAHIPEDRLLRGLVLDFEAARSWSKELIEKYDVRTPNISVTARSLSGGNQQKAVIAREFQRNPKLLIASQPTRGLDVGAIEFVHEQIMEAKKKMTAVLLVSLELSEIMNLSDRILVIYEGKIIGEFKADEATETDLGLLMAGGHNVG